MKIPYRWVGELVELDLSAAQAADRLINAGVEVASVTPLAPDFRGVGEEHEAGLLLLDDGVRPGADLIATLGLDDHVLEVEITPNRPDCLSVLGIARELAALTGARLRPPPVTLRESAQAARGLTRVQIEAPDLCHRFTVRAISAVTVGPSPAWLRMRLRAVGLRPISNVVDATNYVLWELGQPLHAYDAETVTDGTF